MGLDVGTKNIGVALSDETGTLARGVEVVQRKSKTAAVARIREIVKEFNVREIVVGLPVNMNGTLGERALDSRKFAELLKQKTGLPVEFWDERLSTKEAEANLIKASVSRGKRKRIVDRLAAQIILQGYLDSRGTQR